MTIQHPHPPDDSEPQAPPGFIETLRAWHGPGGAVPPDFDDAILHAARTQLGARRRRRVLIRLAPVLGLAAAAAVAFMVFGPRVRSEQAAAPAVQAPPGGPEFVHVVPLSRTRGPAPAPAQPPVMTPSPASPGARVATAVPHAGARPTADACTSSDSILDAFALARRLRDEAALEKAWDCNGDGVIDKRDVDRMAAVAVHIERGT